MDKISSLIFAAGSLRVPMDEIIQAYQAQGGISFAAKYGPSGKLRQQIEAGVKVDVFASASSDHTEVLAQQKLLNPSEVFAHNELCIVARPELNLSTENLLEVLSNKSVRVATSTPLSDPMGDYTWQFFKNADETHAGFYQLLDAKARKLSGFSMPDADEILPYISAFENDQADVYIMYRTNALLTSLKLPELRTVRIPDSLNVRATYTIAAAPGSASGGEFVRFVTAQGAQEILRSHGFDA